MPAQIGQVTFLDTTSSTRIEFTFAEINLADKYIVEVYTGDSLIAGGSQQPNAGTVTFTSGTLDPGTEYMFKIYTVVQINDGGEMVEIRNTEPREQSFRTCEYLSMVLSLVLSIM